MFDYLYKLLKKRREFTQSLQTDHNLILKRRIREMANSNECGIGPGSVLAIVVVAMMLLFVPLMMGPVAPPTPPLILLFPVVLLFVFLCLHFTSKWNLFFFNDYYVSIRMYVFSRSQWYMFFSIGKIHNDICFWLYFCKSKSSFSHKQSVG